MARIRSPHPPQPHSFGLPAVTERPAIAQRWLVSPRWRGTLVLSYLCMSLLAPILAGCKALNVRPQSPDGADEKGAEVKLVGDLAYPHGMQPIRIEAVGLVTGLPGTGSDPSPSPERAALLEEMQKRGVDHPSRILASPSTELVVLRGFLPAGVRKGDRFDIELRVGPRSDCTSLRGGWLMEAPLREMAVTGNSLSGAKLQNGKTLARAQGPVLIDPSAKGNIELTRGRVLGAAIAAESRDLGLIIKPEYKKSTAAKQIADAINRRFHTFEGGYKDGVAEALTGEYVELKVHPRYKDNIPRYMQVIRSLAVRETSSQHKSRLELLERQLREPITSASAATRLEALDKEGIPILKKGMESSDSEVRFYAAEALAYLDQSEAVAPLAQSARETPAFRAFALAALSAMDDLAAYEALREMLSVTSAETRYGAFRALWAMNSRDPLVKGENLGDQFGFHVLATKGPPMVHLSRSFRSEVVLFGQEQTLRTPLVLEAGPEILVNSQGGDQITVSRFSATDADQKRVVAPRLEDVIRAIVELGGTYPDVVQALQMAKAKDYLESRLEVDAIPQAGRSYDRVAGKEDGAKAKDEGGYPANPLPTLFAKLGKPERASRETSDDDSLKPQTSDEEENRGLVRGFFSRFSRPKEK